MSKEGIYGKTARYDRDFLVSTENKKYKVTHLGDLCYNPANLKFGVICLNTYGDAIFSPIYVTFEIEASFDPDFIGAYLTRWDFINRALKYQQGTVYERMAVSPEDFVSIKCCFPQKAEQTRLAEFITLLDKRIAAQGKYVESLKKYKRGLVFHIFRDNNPFGFEMKATPMKDLLHEYRNRDTVNLRVCSVAVNKGVVDQVEHLGRSFAAADTSNYGRVKPGDVVYTKSPTGCFPYGIVKQNWMDEEVAVSPLYGVYTPVSKDAGYLLHTYFEQSQNANNYIRTLAQKGAKNTINITTSHFLDKSILFPSNEDCVSHLAKMFDAISAELSLAEKELELLLRQRKTLLQQLFI